MKLHLTFLSLLCVLVLHAQKSPIIKQVGKEPLEFVPGGWEILVNQKNDFNLDSLQDVVLILKRSGEDSLSTAEKPLKRIFLLLTQQKDNLLKIAVRNENVSYHYNYDGNFKDALADVRTSRGIIHIDHYGGFATRWGRTSTFKYSVKEKNWFLVQDEYSTFKATDIDNTEMETIKTQKDFGKISLSKFDIYKKI